MKKLILFSGVMFILTLNIFVNSEKTNSKKKTTYKRDCIVATGKSVLDLNNLTAPIDYKVIFPGRVFLFNICHHVKQCGDDVAACEIIDGKPKALGLLSQMTILPKFKPNVVLSYKWGNDRKKKTEVFIKFKCNRFLTKSNIYIENLAARKYHFVFESADVCVEQPTNCLIRFKESSYQYDLTPLNKLKENWRVKNSKNDEEIYLNICGKFHIINDGTNECAYKGTQICSISKNGRTKNLGVFSEEFSVDTDLRLNITGGSQCNNNSNIYTIIQFVCSFDEKGPELQNYSLCNYHIIWHTTFACPHKMSVNSNCEVQDKIFGHRHMSLYDGKEQKMHLPDNSLLKFDICKPLSKTCDENSNVSFCLIRNNEEMTFGFTNSTIISKDGLLTMKLLGDLCETKNVLRSVNITFHCDYNKNKSEQISISQDSCYINLDLFTNLACRDSDVPQIDCRTEPVNGSYYDLTPLVLLNKNYEINDPDDTNIDYFINICHPIVFNSETLCDTYSAFCSRHKNEPNIYKRFRSIGNYVSNSKLVYENNKLLLKYVGGICTHGADSTFQIIIEFKCSDDVKDTIPKLIKNECLYTLIWETRYACQTHNLTNHTIIEPNVTEGLNTVKATTKFIVTTSMPSLKPDTNTNLRKTVLNSEVHKIVSIIDDNSNDNKENKPDLGKEKLKIIETDKLPEIYMPLIVPINGLNYSDMQIHNCTINTSDKKFNMSSLPRNINITSGMNRKYSLNICNSQKNICNSEICLSNLYLKNDRQIIEMDFFGKTKCNDGIFNSIIFLKCSNEINQPSILKEEECRVEFEWKNSAVCAFFNDSHVTSSSVVAVAVPITVTIVLLVIGFIIFYVFKRRQSVSCNSPRDRVTYCRIKDQSKVV